MWLLTEEGLAPLLVPKGALDHKRSVGTVLVVGGSRGMTGAAHMTAMAALRAGAGLVHAALPQGAGGEKPFLEVITVEVPGADGQFTAAARSALFDAGRRAQGRGRRGRAWAAPTRRSCWCASCSASTGRCCSTPTGSTRSATGRSFWPIARCRRCSRRTRASSAACSAFRPTTWRPSVSSASAPPRSAAARPCSSRARRRIVADPSGRAYVVPTGNPGLATPGTGDVLSGVIVAQLAKGLGATEAACLGAYLHGLAADLAAENAVGTEGMVAGDVIQFLPAAVERLKAGPQEEAHEHH